MPLQQISTQTTLVRTKVPQLECNRYSNILAEQTQTSNSTGDTAAGRSDGGAAKRQFR